ncbi:MAG: hypothetical protein CMH34_09870 [Microbacterium sp.]|nr:hypothetical protein [Microbacterium sp.]
MEHQPHEQEPGMSDFWSDVRDDLMRRLNDHYPTVPFEERVMIAEDAAREASGQARRIITHHTTRSES